MKLCTLIINQATRESIKKLVAFATEHPFSLNDLKKMMAGTKPPPGDMEGYQLSVGDFRCVLTVEEQPFGMCRHLSVSVNDDGEAPDPTIVLLFMKGFGFKSESLDKVEGLWLEPIPTKDCPKKIAVNILEKMGEEDVCLPS